MNEKARLQLISDIYHWIGLVGGKSERGDQINRLREIPVAWDVCQIVGAIAGGYRIQISPHYKGVQIIRRNPQLWKRVEQFAELRNGPGMLPFDIGRVGDQFQANNPSFAVQVRAFREKFRVPLAAWKLHIVKAQLKTGLTSHHELAEALRHYEEVKKGGK